MTKNKHAREWGLKRFDVGKSSCDSLNSASFPSTLWCAGISYWVNTYAPLNFSLRSASTLMTLSDKKFAINRERVSLDFRDLWTYFPSNLSRPYSFGSVAPSHVFIRAQDRQQVIPRWKIDTMTSMRVSPPCFILAIGQVIGWSSVELPPNLSRRNTRFFEDLSKTIYACSLVVLKLLDNFNESAFDEDWGDLNLYWLNERATDWIIRLAFS